jgi:hypothetical protein
MARSSSLFPNVTCTKKEPDLGKDVSLWKCIQGRGEEVTVAANIFPSCRGNNTSFHKVETGRLN